LYKEYHSKAYSKDKITGRMDELFGDPQVTNKKGVIEYILSDESKPELLNIRVFDENTKRTVYAQQTSKAKAEGVSNCPLCALGTDSNHIRIYKQNEMDADHVAAWSKGGATDISNCTMLCKTHNRAKGNK
jgi:predicted restriction endonuclease